jgi:hypothetical protein
VLGILAGVAIAFAPAIDVSTNVYASTYGILRAEAEKPDAPAGPFADGIGKIKAIEATFPDHIKQRSGGDLANDRERTNALYWRAIDAIVYASDSVDELKASEAKLPDKFGGYLDPKATIEAVAAAIQPALDAKTTESNDLYKNVQADLDYWKSTVEPKIGSVLDGAASKFNLDISRKRLHILLVPEMGGKEGLTVRGKGGPTLVIGTGKFLKSDFAEVLIHELLHAYDDDSKNKGFFADLRHSILNNGQKSEEGERYVHACIIVSAGILTRSNIDASHIDVGDAYGSQSNAITKARESVTQPMRDFFDGRADATTVINTITATAKA